MPEKSNAAPAETEAVAPSAYEKMYARYESMEPIPGTIDSRLHTCQDGSRVVIGGYSPNRGYKPDVSSMMECVVVRPDGTEEGFAMNSDSTPAWVWLPAQSLMIGDSVVLNVSNLTGGGIKRPLHGGAETSNVLADWIEGHFQDGAEYTKIPVTLKGWDTPS